MQRRVQQRRFAHPAGAAVDTENDAVGDVQPQGQVFNVMMVVEIAAHQQGEQGFGKSLDVLLQVLEWRVHQTLQQPAFVDQLLEVVAIDVGGTCVPVGRRGNGAVGEYQQSGRRCILDGVRQCLNDSLVMGIALSLIHI